MILLAIAIIPPIVLLLIVWAVDKIEKESKLLISILFILGAGSGIAIGIMETIMSLFNIFPNGSFIYVFIEMFFIVALCEEGGKYLILFLGTWWHKGFDYKYDAIVYSSSVSLGFATLENVLYVFGSILEGTKYGVIGGYTLGFTTGISRMLLAIPLHFSCSIIMGFFYGYTKMYANKKQNRKAIAMGILSLIVPMFCHGLYDFGLSFNIGLLTLVSLALSVVLDISTIIIIIISVKKDVKIGQVEVTQSMIYRYSPQFQNYYQNYNPNVQRMNYNGNNNPYINNSNQYNRNPNMSMLQNNQQNYNMQQRNVQMQNYNNINYQQNR